MPIDGLLACFSDVTQCFFALVGYILPVFSSYFILREELGTHAYAEFACFHQRGEILLARNKIFDQGIGAIIPFTKFGP